MPTVWATTRAGETRQIEARSGVSLKDNLKRGGMDEILGICGGCASCGTCHVYVAEDWVSRLPPIQDEEETILAFSDWRAIFAITLAVGLVLAAAIRAAGAPRSPPVSRLGRGRPRTSTTGDGTSGAGCRRDGYGDRLAALGEARAAGL